MSNEGNHEFCPESIVNPGHAEITTEVETSWNNDIRMVLIGNTGSGKSASGNTILGRRQFTSCISASSVTQVCELGDAELPEEEEEACSVSLKRKMGKRSRVQVVDMPGFGDTHLSEEAIHTEIAKCVTLSSPGLHAFLLVIPIGRYTDNENNAADEVSKIFGEYALKHHTVVLFTRGDDLEGVSIESYLNDTAPARLKILIDRCGGRYHVFNNKDISNRTQVKELFVTVHRMHCHKGFYTNDMFLKAEKAIREEEERVLKERGLPKGDNQQGNVITEEVRLAKKQRHDVERTSTVRTFGAHRLRKYFSQKEEACGEMEVSRQATSSICRDVCRGPRHLLNLSAAQIRREAALSPVVLEKIKILVAAGATGLAVGAMFGAAAPLSAAVGASLMGNSVGMAAGPLVGISAAGGAGVGKAVGAIVAAATGKTAVTVGAATGGLVGGSVGAAAGAEASSLRKGATDALRQVSMLGVTAVGMAAGVGSALGVGAALGAALEAGSTAVIGGSASSVGAEVGLANASITQVGLASVQNALPQSAVAIAQDTGTRAPALIEAVGAFTEPSVTSLGTRLLNTVADISKAAASIALAGGLVVKVVKEKVRGGGGTEGSSTEKSTYEIYWNSQR